MNRLVNHAPRAQQVMGLEQNAHKQQQTKNGRRITKASICAPAQVQKTPIASLLAKEFLFIFPVSPSDLNLNTWLHSRCQRSSSPSEVAALLHGPGLCLFIVLPNRLRLFLWFRSRACRKWNANKGKSTTPSPKVIGKECNVPNKAAEEFCWTGGSCE